MKPRLKVEAEIYIKKNYRMNWKEFYKYITKPEQIELLKNVLRNRKYTFLKARSKHESISYMCSPTNIVLIK